MGGVHEDGGNAIAHALLLEGDTDRSFMAKTDRDWATELRGGSANLDMIANAAALLWDGNKRPWIDSWLVYFEKDKRTFQRSEPWSVIYTGWHVIPVLAVYWWAVRNGERELELASREWLRNLFSLFALSHSTLNHHSYVTLAGARSSGMPIEHWFSHRAIWCEALGEHWPGRGENHPEDELNNWCGLSVYALRSEIKALSAEFVSMMRQGNWEGIFAASPKMGMRAGGNIVRTVDGVAAWQEKDINGNTAGLLAIKSDRGHISSLPPNGGPYFRMKHTKATCRLEGGLMLHYESPEPVMGSHSMSLPGGATLLQVAITEHGWELVYPKPSPVVPEPPAPVVPPSKPKPKKRSFFQKLLDFFKDLF